MPVRTTDILLRVGGRALQRYGVLACAGAGRTEVTHTLTRTDGGTPLATFFGSDGILRKAAQHVPRIQWEDLDGDGVRETPGILLEGLRTNVVLWNRDLTNAAWTKTNVTAVKDQTGIDGVASSASRITASAGNGTCLQAITLGSSQRLQSCYIKRLVGSGNIDMTTDNGSTWTTVTATTAWTRVKIPAQTLANPTVGFRIVTNADSVAIDFVQNETGAFESSPLATTTTSVARADDSLTMPYNFGPMDVTVYARIARPPWADAAGTLGTFPGFGAVSFAASPSLRLYGNSTTRAILSDVFDGGSSPSVSLSVPAGTSLSICAQYRLLTTGGKTKLDVGSGFGSESAAAAAFSAFGNQTLCVGDIGGTNELFGVMLDFVVARGLFTLTEMLAIP